MISGKHNIKTIIDGQNVLHERSRFLPLHKTPTELSTYRKILRLPSLILTEKNYKFPHKKHTLIQFKENIVELTIDV